MEKQLDLLMRSLQLIAQTNGILAFENEFSSERM